MGTNSRYQLPLQPIKMMGSAPRPFLTDSQVHGFFRAGKLRRPCMSLQLKKKATLLGEREVSRKHFSMYLNEQGVWIVQNYSRFGTSVNGDILECMLDLPESFERSRHALTPGAPNTIITGGFSFIIHSIPHSSIHSGVAGCSITPLLDISSMGLDSQTTHSSTVGTSDSTVKPTTPPTDVYYYLEDDPVIVRGPSKVFMALHKRTGFFYVAKVYDKWQEERARLQYEIMLSLKVRN
jgi:hypothetical protein